MHEQQQRAAAENFRGLLNDLKRRPQDASRELGTSVEEITAILEGRAAIRPELVRRATEIWPVNERDFYLLRDDCPNGVRIMRAEESKASSRIMARAGKPYYDYRDTAMSSVAQFRPEWIQELCVVTDNDPDNPAVQWNNGHFLHQFTYFVGPVNFYYKGPNGKKVVAVMNTGDSMYITPFTPHSFTTRANPSGELGLILALTYGASLAGEAHQELGALGTELASAFAMDYSSRAKAAGELLRAHRNASTMSVAELASRSGIDAAEISRFEHGSATPSAGQYERFAEALAIDLRDLLPPDAVEDKVVVRHHNEGRCWTYPDEDVRYQIVELASTRSLPWSKGLEVTLRHTPSTDLDLQVGLHQVRVQHRRSRRGALVEPEWCCPPRRAAARRLVLHEAVREACVPRCRPGALAAYRRSARRSGAARALEPERRTSVARHERDRAMVQSGGPDAHLGQ